MTISIENIKKILLDLQNRIQDNISALDNKAIWMQDNWQYEVGKGGGNTRVMSESVVFERVGVNFSHIQGQQLPSAATQKRPHLPHCPFQALGISVVIHPLNPYVPTSHMNLRFFVVESRPNPIWWFGGGFDLTPYYAFDEDCRHWHTTARELCVPFGAEVYPRYKKSCDEYFYLPHRKETRGIGGLFFDDLNEWEFDQCVEFMRAVGEGYLQAYLPIIKKRMQHTYGTREREFQLYRRGRYVEFNLLYDRGTLFGLHSGGRTESILMSLPPQVIWKYHWQAEPNSAEEELQNYLKPREWCD